MIFLYQQINESFQNTIRSGGGVVDNTLDYQSRDRKIETPFLRSFGWDFKPKSRLRMTSLLVGRETRVHSLKSSSLFFQQNCVILCLYMLCFLCASRLDESF